MTGQPLDFIPMWALYLLTVLAMLATMEAGYRLTKARQRKSPDRTDTSVGAISGASLALLVFLLALVPVVGPFTNIFVIGAVALVQGSTTLALHPVALAALAVVINLIFVAIVAELILPKIWGSAVSLPTTDCAGKPTAHKEVAWVEHVARPNYWLGTGC